MRIFIDGIELDVSLFSEVCFMEVSGFGYTFPFVVIVLIYFFLSLMWIGIVNQLLPETEEINRFAPQ